MTRATACLFAWWCGVAVVRAAPEKVNVETLKQWFTPEDANQGPVARQEGYLEWCPGFDPLSVTLLVSDLVSTDPHPEHTDASSGDLTVGGVSKLCRENYGLQYPIRLNYMTDPSGSKEGHFYAGLRVKSDLALAHTPDADKFRCDRKCCLHVLEPLHSMTLPPKVYLRAAHGTRMNEWVYSDVITDAAIEYAADKPKEGVPSPELDEQMAKSLKLGVCALVHLTTSGMKTIEVLEAFLFDPQAVIPNKYDGDFWGSLENNRRRHG